MIFHLSNYSTTWSNTTTQPLPGVLLKSQSLVGCTSTVVARMVCCLLSLTLVLLFILVSSVSRLIVLPLLFCWLDRLYTSIHPSKIEFKGGQTLFWWPWRVKSHKWSFDWFMRKYLSHQPAELVTYPTISPFKSPSKLQQLVQSPFFNHNKNPKLSSGWETQFIAPWLPIY